MQLRISLQKAQGQQVAEANKHRRLHSFQEGDQVLVSTKDLPISYATGVDDHRKVLHHKYIGPFELGKRCGENAFEVLFPMHWQISRTQNVSKLKPSLIDHTREQIPAPALREEGANREGAFPVEAIGSWQRNPECDGRIEYEVKWEDDSDLSWEPEENLKGAEDVLVRMRPYSRR